MYRTYYSPIHFLNIKAFLEAETDKTSSAFNFNILLHDVDYYYAGQDTDLLVLL